MRLREGISAVAVVVALLLLGAMVAFFIAQANEISTGEAQHMKINMQRSMLYTLIADLQDAETGQRGFLLTGEDIYLQPYLRAIDSIDRDIEETRKLFADEPVVLQKIDNIQELTKLKLAEMAQTIMLRRTAGQHAAIAVMKTDLGKVFMDQLRVTIGRLLEEKHAERTRVSLDIARWVTTAIYLVAGISAFVVLALGLASWQIIRALRLNAALSTRLKREAGHDELTGLPNRRFVTQWLTQALAIAERNKSIIAVLFIDLDGFKQVNDNFGHETGDAVLCAATERFKKTLRRADLLARFGGDEFAVVTMSNQTNQDLPTLAQRLIESLNEPLLAFLPPNTVGASIGISIFPGDGKSADALMNAADVAMYRAKKDGKGRFCFAVTAAATSEPPSAQPGL
jgi:diguanylate cyclase (GGDEF)-like protein